MHCHTKCVKSIKPKPQKNVHANNCHPKVGVVDLIAIIDRAMNATDRAF